MYCGNGKWMLYYEKQLFNEKLQQNYLDKIN